MNYRLANQKVATKLQRNPSTRVSKGGLDEINPQDIVYGEHASGVKHGIWIDVVYLDADILRAYSGPITKGHRLVEELRVLLRDDEEYFVVSIKEVPRGFAFKRTDIVSIEVTSNIRGNDNHAPSCVWTVHFKDGSTRTLEADYQAYFAYSNVIRPKKATNGPILEKVFAEDGGK